MASSKVTRVLGQTMTVADLREVLADCPDDAAVVLVCDYGDRCHTQQALTIQECVMADGELVDSGYSQSGIAYRAYDEMDEEDRAEYDTPPNVVVLR